MPGGFSMTTRCASSCTMRKPATDRARAGRVHVDGQRLARGARAPRDRWRPRRRRAPCRSRTGGARRSSCGRAAARRRQAAMVVAASASSSGEVARRARRGRCSWQPLRATLATDELEHARQRRVQLLGVRRRRPAPCRRARRPCRPAGAPPRRRSCRRCSGR